jgi:hypothetical protein
VRFYFDLSVYIEYLASCKDINLGELMNDVRIFVFMLCSILAACSKDNTSNPQPEKLQGGFSATEVSGGRVVPISDEERKAMLRGRTMAVPYERFIPKKTVHTIVLVTNETYHEYEIVQTESKSGYKSKPILTENVYKYTMNQDGLVEMVKIADACGKYNAAEDERVVFKPMTANGMLQSTQGRLLARKPLEEVTAQITEIENGKQNNVYDLSCWKWVRTLKNGLDRFLSEDNNNK